MDEEYLSLSEEILDEEECTAPEEDSDTTLKLDYKLKTMEERTELVNKIVENTPSSQLSHHFLEILGDYIMDAVSKEDKKNRTLMTKNRLITINKRETSYEGLVEKFENGEDGIYSMMTEDKNILLTPKISITEEDVAAVPGLKQLRDAIQDIEEECKKATGRRKYLLKKQLIEMRKDQYILKNAFYQPMATMPSPKTPHYIEITGHKWIDENGEPQSNELVSLFNPLHISALLCNYNLFNFEFQGKFQSDFYYLFEEFKSLMEKVLPNYPYYQRLTELKIAGVQNMEIQEKLSKELGIWHSIEHISALWRHKIPKLLAEQAKKDYLIWYYTEKEYGAWKCCSKCKEVKLAHSYFFSKNRASKDGFYSICKECRNKK